MAATDVQAVLYNPANFDALVTALLSADNDTRKQGEAVFEQLKAHPDGLLTNSLRVVRQSQSAEHRSFCAILLRKVRGRGSDSMCASQGTAE